MDDGTADDKSIYVSGAYWDENASMHLEDSDFKVSHALKLLAENNIRPQSIIDCGCGAGRVSFRFAEAFDVQITGLDVSSQAVEAAKSLHTNDRLCYRVGAIAAEPDGAVDLGLMFDVFEHVDDYLGFLRAAKQKARYWLFNVPLDMSVMHVWDGTYMQRRQSVGHLHYFSEDSARATLVDAGYTIINDALAGYHDLTIAAAQGWKQKLRHMPGKWLYRVAPSTSVRLFGNASLMVLCGPDDG